MENNNKIDIEAFELDKGIYYVELVTGVYDIDNKRIRITWDNNKVILDLDSNPEIFKITSQSRIKEYKDSNGNVLSVSDYNAQKDILTKNTESDDYNTYIFSDLDEEYAFKKFNQQWLPQHEQLEIRTKVDYNIKYNVYNLPKWITPMRKLNGNLKNTIYQYDRPKHILELTRQALKEIGYIETDRESTKLGEFYLKKDSIRFSKIDNGSFLTIQISELRQYEEKGIYKDSYPKVFEMYNSDIENIGSIIKTYYLAKTKVNGYSYGEILDSLRKFQTLAMEVEVKTKSVEKKRMLVTGIGNLIGKIKRELPNTLEKI